MTWHPGTDPYFQVSDPRGYTICKFGTADGWLYEAWRVGAKRALATRLPSADAARATVERVAA